MREKKKKKKRIFFLILILPISHCRGLLNHSFPHDARLTVSISSNDVEDNVKVLQVNRLEIRTGLGLICFVEVEDCITATEWGMMRCLREVLSPTGVEFISQLHGKLTHQ